MTVIWLIYGTIYLAIWTAVLFMVWCQDEIDEPRLRHQDEMDELA